MKRPPLWTMALAAMMTVASAGDAQGPLHAALRFERASIVEEFEVWRIVTGQLLHGTPRLFAVDVACVTALAWIVERRSGHVMRLLFGSALAAGLGTLWLAPEIEFLEGASGIASGLLACLLVDLMAVGGRRQSRVAAFGSVVFAGKLHLELVLGDDLAWWGDPMGETRVVAAAHLCGALAGLIARLVGGRQASRSSRFSQPRHLLVDQPQLDPVDEGRWLKRQGITARTELAASQRAQRFGRHRVDTPLGSPIRRSLLLRR
ncbi:Rhomboid family protein [Planctomycetes bacterium Poly30]|uniref:Rhomboid family protein n=1 Tax=Saltatorellus ferox TaxID=2528018 RepID=A0A518EKV3_9BACT|nr:Rhomboid family protein [Planctomycetes bacterium Poly30]